MVVGGRVLERLSGGDGMATRLTTDQRIAILDRMLLIRRFEEMLIDLAGDNFFGHYHLYIGEEATGATVV